MKTFSNLSISSQRLWGIGPSLTDTLKKIQIDYEVSNDEMNKVIEGTSNDFPWYRKLTKDLHPKHNSLSMLDKLIMVAGTKIQTKIDYDMKYLTYGCDSLVLMNTRHLSHKPMYGCAAFSGEYILEDQERVSI